MERSLQKNFLDALLTAAAEPEAVKINKKIANEHFLLDQHNVVPDRCEFTVDIRTNEFYPNEKMFELIKSQVGCEIKARSFRIVIVLEYSVFSLIAIIGIKCTQR